MERNVVELLENAARLYKDKTAVRDTSGECSFAELCRNAKAIGSALTEHDIFGDAIPVYMEKGIVALEVFWGITYAGGSYSLLNPVQPANRIEKILEVLDAPVVITDGEHLPALKEMRHSAKILMAEDLLKAKIQEDKLNVVKNKAIDTDALYVNFTSGSTGTPKGVVVSHRAVIEFIHYFVEIFGITSEDIIGNQAPFDFDVSVKDIYSMLLTGATLYIIPKDYFAFPKKILDVLEAEKITTLIWAVSALCVITTLKSFSYKVPTSVNKVLFSGEVMPVNHLREWMRVLPDAMFVNLYGPTEITCNCTYYIIDRTLNEDKIPIGKAFPNERVFLLDEGQNEVVEPKVEGEICVAGSTLGLGYFRDREKTEAAFVQNPLNDKNNEQIYRTGDIAFYREDGNLVYVGRRDFQIKHMGHRIEMGEIEACMNEIEGVERVCCLYDEDKQEIVAFYQGTAEKLAIKKALRGKLIKYVIPERYVTVETMPLTPNGKIDRKLLRQSYLEQK
ncbi:MAG: amino acid adenylation domain-containing protein [Lachnospiraceae bacterium]|nr:amino acid adenylation domain-containing protein [Lachnospiraceae bacterium]